MHYDFIKTLTKEMGCNMDAKKSSFYFKKELDLFSKNLSRIFTNFEALL